jgi:hypothetical protein
VKIKAVGNRDVDSIWKMKIRDVQKKLKNGDSRTDVGEDFEILL